MRRASITYEHLPKDVKPGNLLLLDDGLLQIEVLEVQGTMSSRASSLVGRFNNKGVNLPQEGVGPVDA